jgi:ABC-2 type transport system permease protein
MYNPVKKLRDLLKDCLLTSRVCLSVFRIKTTEGFQYRLAGIAGASVSIFWALIEITVYSVFYHHAADASAGILAGLTLKQLVTYAWLAQVFFLMQPMNIDGDILNKIITGDVGIEMCRPLDLYLHWFSKNAAGRLVPLFWRGSVVLLAGMLMPSSFRMLPPVSFMGLLCAFVSLFSAFLLCAAFATFVCSVRLNITWGEGPTYIIMLVGGVLSGTYLPLQLWPEFLQKFLFLQPFAGYLDIPLRLYLGTLPACQALPAIGLQLLWTAGFILAGKRILSKRIAKIIVQGG